MDTHKEYNSPTSIVISDARDRRYDNSGRDATLCNWCGFLMDTNEILDNGLCSDCQEQPKDRAELGSTWDELDYLQAIPMLIDSETSVQLRPATPDEITASILAANGLILLDAAGEMIDESEATQPWVVQPVKKVWVMIP